MKLTSKQQRLLDSLAKEASPLSSMFFRSVDRYPRVTFRIDVKVDRHVSFAGSFRQSELERIRRRCLSPTSLAFSQNVGQHLEARGVQAILYSSVTGAGANVVVFVRNTKADQVVIFNRAKVIAQIARLKNS